MKKWIGKLHLYLGLVSGIMVVIISITGCILAFEQEIKTVTQPYMFVKGPTGGKVLPPSQLADIARKALPGKVAKGVLYDTPDRNAQVGFYNLDPAYYYVVYVNQYTGKVGHIWNEDDDFFHFILHGHYYLWLPEQYGQTVVASATLVFLFMMISGMVLWWPKNKSAAKQRFSIKWNAAWRRKNYDLHNVLGFYVMSIGVILAVTGLVWGFHWFSQGLYTATGGEGSDLYYNPASDTVAVSKVAGPMQAVDKAWYQLQSEYPKYSSLNISFPTDKAESIFSYVNFRAGTYYNVDYHYFDQYSVKEIDATGPYSGKFSEANFGKKLRRMNYDIHTGAILGLPGKMLMFFASLVCASLPVTGFVIWWGRKKKAPKKVRRAAQVMNAEV